MRNKLPTRDVVLIGAGHTNLHVVRMFRMAPLPDVRLTIVSPFSRASYSGMLPGTLAGLYTADDMEIDLYRLAAPSGIRVIIDEAVRVDSEKRRVHFRTRPPIRFDIASIGIGSVPAGYSEWSVEPGFLPIKPMATFRSRLEARLSEFEASAKSDPIQAVVVGGGAAGTEIAMCLEAYLASRNTPGRITLVDGAEEILRRYEKKTRHRVVTHLEQRGISLCLGSRVRAVRDGAVEFESGDTIPADIVLWATAASAPPLLANVDLPKASDGFLAVRSSLQTVADRPVFAVGDSATLVDRPVPKAGVYAVREGPVLWENIRRMLKSEPLQAYQPQDGFLSLLADGNGRAFASFQGMTGYSQWAWKLKDYIDRRFMRMYQAYEPMVITVPDNKTELPEMRCRGCGGKAGAGVLTAALERLADDSSAPNSHSALSGPEDAAMLHPDVTRADLVSVDFFQAFLDDPWIVGRVAALNSLSDIWAMGARPFGAMAMVQVQEGHPRQQTELLYQVLSGALHEFSKADVELLGGHTTEATELTAGFTILGSLDGGSPLRKEGLAEGDALILTKPLGTGALLAGIPQAVTRGVWVDEMLTSMLKSNQQAARIARDRNCVALTDITGFGLAGHLLEMLDASQVDATLRLTSVPLLTGFTEVVSSGIESTLAPANREIETRLKWDDTEDFSQRPEAAALFDPQTSGGLMIATRKEDAETMLKTLSTEGIQASVVGAVGSASSQPVLTIRE
jgi:selenide,water dikinase